MASPLRQPRRAIGNVGRGSKVAPTPVKRSPVQHSGMGGPGSFKKPKKAKPPQQGNLTKFIELQKKLIEEAAKRNATKPRGVPTGPRGLPRGVAPPKQVPRPQPLSRRNPRTMPGFGYGRSARGALGSRGRPNAKRANPSMRGGYPATPYTGMVNIGGRQYSKGGLLKSSSKLNTGIKSGK